MMETLRVLNAISVCLNDLKFTGNFGKQEIIDSIIFVLENYSQRFTVSEYLCNYLIPLNQDFPVRKNSYIYWKSFLNESCRNPFSDVG